MQEDSIQSPPPSRLGSFLLLLILCLEIFFLFEALFDARQLQRLDANHFVLRSTLFAGYHVALFHFVDFNVQGGIAFRAAGHGSLLTFQTESYRRMRPSSFDSHR